MNMMHDGKSRDPALPAGHPAVTAGDTPRAAKPTGNASRVPEPAQPALRRLPPRVRKVDSGEVYRFWAFR